MIDEEKQAETASAKEETAVSTVEKEHTGGEHHHHRHHSSHRSSSDRKKKSKKKTLIDRLANANRIAMITIVILLTALLIVCAFLIDEREFGNGEEETVEDLDKETVSLRLPFFAEEVSLVSEEVSLLMRVGADVTLEEYLAAYQNAGRLDSGKAVKLSYAVTDLPVGCVVTGVKVEVDESNTFASPRVVTSESAEGSLELSLLQTGTVYYYRLTATLSNGQTLSGQGTFVTSVSPRILGIAGIANVRDIGGYRTVDGKTVRQGLLYRGSELDGATVASNIITSVGISDMLTVLGIRTEMDLRVANEGIGALGANVNRYLYNAPKYGGYFAEGGKAAVADVFSDLAVAENYPIYLHDAYGVDETGSVCYLLGALLGMSEEDLVREFRLSTLAYRWTDATQLNALRDGLSACGGDTLAEQAEQYLLSIGVTEAEIAAIRAIFLTNAA